MASQSTLFEMQADTGEADLPHLDTLASVSKMLSFLTRKTLRYKPCLGAANEPFEDFVRRLWDRGVIGPGYASCLLFHICLLTYHFNTTRDTYD
jgi:hypothetical protein